MKTNVHTCKRPKLKTPQMPINRRMGKSPKKKKKNVFEGIPYNHEKKPTIITHSNPDEFLKHNHDE